MPLADVQRGGTDRAREHRREVDVQQARRRFHRPRQRRAPSHPDEHDRKRDRDQQPQRHEQHRSAVNAEKAAWPGPPPSVVQDDEEQRLQDERRQQQAALQDQRLLRDLGRHQVPVAEHDRGHRPAGDEAEYSQLDEQRHGVGGRGRPRERCAGQHGETAHDSHRTDQSEAPRCRARERVGDRDDNEDDQQRRQIRLAVVEARSRLDRERIRSRSGHRW